MKVKWWRQGSKIAMNATKILVGLILVIAIGATAFLLWPNMPTMSERGNEAATALLSATNRKDEKAVQAVETQIQAWVTDGVLTTSDEEVLTSIIDLAKAKKWDKANEKARQLKEAQIVERP